jgi:hypothetical protein
MTSPKSPAPPLASATRVIEKPKPQKTRAGNVGLAEENPF